MEQNNTFAIEPNNQQTYRTAPISPESFNEKNTLSYQLTFSFAFLSKEKENIFSLNQPYGMFPVEGKSFVSQVHNGVLLAKVLKLNNHNLLTEEYAIDIGEPLGSNVLAFDNGTIMWKEDNFGDYGCARTRYISQGNALKILHDNGTESLYLHLKQDSIIVEVGQKVEKGQIIAKVGASGYTSTPQLHFQLGAMTNEGVRTIPLKFQLLSSDALWVPKLLTNVTNEKN